MQKKNLKQKEGQVVFVNFQKRKIVSNEAETAVRSNTVEISVPLDNLTDEEFHRNDEFFISWPAVAVVVLLFGLVGFSIYKSCEELKGYFAPAKTVGKVSVTFSTGEKATCSGREVSACGITYTECDDGVIRVCTTNTHEKSVL